jgi:hypothetical protein
MRTPAAIARTAKTTPKPLRDGTSWIKPHMMSQMANKSIPMFLTDLLMIGILPV